jgi:hypothetical protein
VTYPVLKFFHLLGVVLMGAGLIGVWYADLRSRQLRELSVFAEAGMLTIVIPRLYPLELGVGHR